jgi:type II secretory pathway component GspD/PulD (secretin)
MPGQPIPIGGGMPGQPQAVPSPSTAPGTENKMVVVDVVIISTEEDFANSKGTNLLRGLQIQFGGASGPAYSRNFSSSTGGSSTGGVAAPETGTSTLAVTRSITLPSIAYSLNIFNMSSARNEILARPTLVATAGKPSEFFSGAELNAVVVNSSNNSSASPVNIQKDIGTTLSIVPAFLEDGRVSMRVTAQRTFIKTPNSNLTGFDARVETSKSKVDASVVMRPGETLILSGLSEKEGEVTRDGVPLLQDIPGLQYLFSRSTERNYQKSTLILITPRPPQYVYQPEKARAEYEKSLSEDERPFASLRSRYADWFRPYPNWASVFHHLQENARYREFRTGDVALENWTDMRSLRDRLNKVIDFLHY